MPECHNCNHDNRPGILFCEECGADMYGHMIEQLGTTQKLKIRRADDPIYAEDEKIQPIVLEVRDIEKTIVLEREGNVVLGRTDTATPRTTPDIDLASYGAAGKGVSRRHALLAVGDEPPVLIDLNSANGTFVNGQKLIPDRPILLHNGDELRFGRLVMRINI